MIGAFGVFIRVVSIYANLLEQKKAFTHRTGLGHKHNGRRFIVLGHKYGHHDVM